MAEAKDNNTTELCTRKCVPCRGGVDPLSGDALHQMLQQLPRDEWKLLFVNGHSCICRKYTFPNFKIAMQFLNLVAAVANTEKHHPNIHLVDYRDVELEIYTHAINGLHPNDFILAAKCDKEFDQIKDIKGAAKDACVHHASATT